MTPVLTPAQKRVLARIAAAPSRGCEVGSRTFPLNSIRVLAKLGYVTVKGVYHPNGVGTSVPPKQYHTTEAKLTAEGAQAAQEIR